MDDGEERGLGCREGRGEERESMGVVREAVNRLTHGLPSDWVLDSFNSLSLQNALVHSLDFFIVHLRKSRTSMEKLSEGQHKGKAHAPTQPSLLTLCVVPRLSLEAIERSPMLTSGLSGDIRILLDEMT